MTSSDQRHNILMVLWLGIQMTYEYYFKPSPYPVLINYFHLSVPILFSLLILKIAESLESLIHYFCSNTT